MTHVHNIFNPVQAYTPIYANKIKPARLNKAEYKGGVNVESSTNLSLIFFISHSF